MDKATEFIAKRRVVSLGRKNGFIYTQRVKMSSYELIGAKKLNKEGNLRGMMVGSQKAIEGGYKQGFGNSSRKNLGKCTDIFFWSCSPSKGVNPITRKKGWLAAAFITLTIPDMHTVIDSKAGYDRLLKGFIKWLCKEFNVKSYVWKFEWQERGQGHWHIFVDRFCEASKLQNEWMYRLAKAGLTNEWYKKHNYDPHHSCKVKGVRSESDLELYLQKYMSKSSQNKKTTEGRSWGASLWIKKAKLPKLPDTDQFRKNLEIACEGGAFMRKVIEIASVEGSLPLKIGESFWTRKFRADMILCNEQRKWFSAYIAAYKSRNWKKTWELDVDLEAAMIDYSFWQNSQVYAKVTDPLGRLPSRSLGVAAVASWPLKGMQGIHAELGLELVN
jgi:hypothetical protein